MTFPGEGEGSKFSTFTAKMGQGKEGSLDILTAKMGTRGKGEGGIGVMRVLYRNVDHNHRCSGHPLFLEIRTPNRNADNRGKICA